MRRTILLMSLVAILATACGKGVSDQSGFISQAALRSLAARSVKVTVSISGTPRDQAPAMSEKGVIDLVHNRAEFTISGAGSGENIGTDETIFVEGAIYSEVPPEFRKQLGPHIKWVRGVISKEDMKTSPLGENGFSNLADPGALLKVLKNVSSSVTVIGHPRIRGVKTTEYSAAIDGKKVFSGQTPTDIPVPGPQTARVYVGDDGLVYRLETELSSTGIKIETVADFSDYGTPVDIKIPPASEVIDENKMAELFSKQIPKPDMSFDPSGIYQCINLGGQNPPGVPTCSPQPS